MSFEWRVPRQVHKASLIRDTITKEIYVAVVGGFKSKPFEIQDTTEILRHDQWSLGTLWLQKKSYWPKNMLIIKFHNFIPLVDKLNQNNHPMDK